MSVKTTNILLTEAFVVGIGLVVLVFIIKKMDKVVPNIFKNGKEKLLETAFISGFIFHLICEYTGVNAWYSLEYCKLLKKVPTVD